MVTQNIGWGGNGCEGRSCLLRIRHVLCVYVIGLVVLSGVSSVFAAGADSIEPLVAEPDTYRTDNYRAPVPATLQGAQVVDVGAAEDLWNAKTAVFIDVYPQPPKPPNLPKGTIWRSPSHESIAGAYWLANVGYGVLSSEFERYFRTGLKRLTGGDPSRPIVFFCLRDCWMSWNAARRALSWGYRNVIWFPDGTDGWKELGLPVSQIKPES